MGWTESNLATTKEIAQAVRSLRTHLGQTQAEFADHLELSKRAIERYEKDRRPAVPVLARLAKTASDAGLAEPTITFMRELGRDLKLGEIRGGTMGRGYVLLQFDPEANGFANAIFLTFACLQSKDPELKAAAEKLLREFTAEANKTWKPVNDRLYSKRKQDP